MKAINILAVVAGAAALYFANTVFIPIISSYFLFVLLDPLVVWCGDHNLKRTLSSLVLVGFSVLVSALLLWAFYGSFANIAREVPNYSSKLKKMITSVQSKAETIEKNTSTIVPKTQQPDDVQKVEVVQGYGPLTSFVFKGINTVLDVLTYGLFIPLLSLFFLLEKPDLRLAIKKVAPKTWNIQQIGVEMEDMVRAYFVGNLTIGLGMSLFLTILFMAFKIENAVPLGVAAGFLNLIPFLGPFLSLILPLAAGLLQFNSLAPFLIIALTVIFLHFLVSNIIVPKVVGSRINVNTVAATIGLLFWGWLWGAIGLLLAVPLMAVVKILLKNNSETELYSHLLSENAVHKGKNRLRRFISGRVEPSP